MRGGLSMYIYIHIAHAVTMTRILPFLFTKKLNKGSTRQNMLSLQKISKYMELNLRKQRKYLNSGI